MNWIATLGGIAAALAWMGAVLVCLALTHPDGPRRILHLASDEIGGAGLALIWLATAIAVGTSVGALLA